MARSRRGIRTPGPGTGARPSGPVRPSPSHSAAGALAAAVCALALVCGPASAPAAGDEPPATGVEAPAPTPTPDAVPAAVPPAVSPAPDPTAAAAEAPLPADLARLAWLFDRVRAESGLTRARLDPRLTRAAQAHSEDMVARDFFDHVNPDGEDPGDRAKRAGYRGSTGEVLTYGPRTPDRAMRNWLHSGSHRRILHNGRYQAFGVGRAGTTWTLLVGTR